MDNLKILWITPTPTKPINSGNRRHLDYLLSSASTRGGTIDFILYGWEAEYSNHLSEYQTRFSRSINFPQPTHKQMSYVDYWGIDDWVSDDFMQAVKNFVQDIHYDVVVVQYVWMSRVLDIFDANIVKIIDAQDVFSHRDLLLEKQGLEKQWYYTRPDQERIGLARADIVLGITREECSFFDRILTHENHTTKPEIIHCGSGISQQLPVRTNQNRSKAVTFGYLASSNALNKASINQFFQTLSEHIKTAKNFHINIGGSICNHVDDKPNIKVFKKGYVSHIEQFYSDVDIILAPMIEGTGLKIKSIEALEFNKPLIATKHATNDLPTKSMWHTFESIEIMAKHLANWLEKNEKPVKNNCTLKYLQHETSRILFEISHEQLKREDEIWQSVNQKISTRKNLKVARLKNATKLQSTNRQIIANPDQTRLKPCNSMTTVSVIIAAYNTENYIARCLDSILQDSLSNFEIILINDGSTDNTGKIIDEYAKAHRNVSVVHQANAGQGAARNRGIDLSSGEYIYFVDSDDTIGKDSLHHMYEMSKKHDLDICSPDRPYLDARPLEFISALTGWCCFIKKEILESGTGKIRQPVIRSGQDGVFANMLLTRCKKSGVCKEAKYFYEQRADSTFNTLKKDLTAVPDLVEEHVTTLRQFYDQQDLFNSQAARYVLFLQDETYKWRLMNNINGLKKIDAERIYLIIKSELVIHLPKVPAAARAYLDRKFINITTLSFSDFVRGL